MIYQLLSVHTIQPSGGDVLPYAMMKYVDTGGLFEHLMVDDNWAAEQKMDGTRTVVSVKSDEVRWVAGGTTHAAAKLHHPIIGAVLFDHLRLDGDDEIVLDGELMIRTGEFFVFDIIRLNLDGNQLVSDNTPHFQRREILERLFDMWSEQHPQQRVLLVSQARTEQEKRDLLAAVHEEGGEGIVLKHLYGAYEPNKRSKLIQKVKFVKTADVVVTGSTRSTNAAGRETGAFQFAVYDLDQETLIEMGSCSAIGKPDARLGDVIEVAYLYRDESGGLVQPRMKRIREDKMTRDCLIDQFPTYSRKAVTFW